MSNLFLIDNLIPSVGPCPNCGSDAEPHSPACPAGERYRQVQDLGGVPLPRMTSEETAEWMRE
jgi:hypothetical protein